MLTLELTHLVGNPRLTPGPSVDATMTSTQEATDRHLIELLELQIRMQRFLTIPLEVSVQSHWQEDSTFRKVQSELDKFLLHFPDEICSTQPVLHRWLDEGCVTPIHCSLTWHCCVILLNRVCLPIRVAQSNEMRDDCDGYVASADQISYPNEPVHFLAERKNACIASASSVATICNEFMTRGNFLPVSASTGMTIVCPPLICTRPP